MMKNKFIRKLLGGLLSVAALLTLPTSAADIRAEAKDDMSVWNSSGVAAFNLFINDGCEARPLSVPLHAAHRVTTQEGATLSPQLTEGLMLCPGGMPFGVKFITEGVTVVGFCDVEVNGKKVNPAETAGLKLRDIILKINGEPLAGAAQLTSCIEGCNGQELILLCKRQNEELELHLTPVYSPAESRYKTGIWVRDSGAGIGTVTFVMPETGAFAGLGHGICDADTGELIAMRRGTVADVTISSVVKGAAGAPGELKGYFNPGKIGSLLGNTACGVWGVLTEMPSELGEPLPVGSHNDLHDGAAYIISTLDSNKTERYDVEISNINRDAKGSKCFTVKITDPDLLAASGGIVQGMSGSPIIQDGKLVGAVTHVLINDPTAGYGIFIENMLVNLPVVAR